MKFQTSKKVKRNKGFTLMELLVGLGLSGLVFMALMSLISQSAKFSSYFHGTASAIEGINETITQLNTVLSQVVLVRSCGCRGAASTNLSNCLWDDSSAANAWYDPVRSGGANDAATGLGHQILDAEIESFYGGQPDHPSFVPNQTLQLLTSNMPGSFLSALGGCLPRESLPATQRRGCKQRLQLFYKAPTLESGYLPNSTPSNSGALFVLVGSGAVSSTSAGLMRIGDIDRDGANGFGVTELACGFNRAVGSASVAGLLFVLNLKLKGRGTTLQNTSHPNYESWYPTSPKYAKGLFRELNLKYTFRNLGTRGLFFWRPQTVRSCVVGGATAGSREECCSMAANSSNVCLATCRGAGVAVTGASECCSERASGGVCL